MSFIQRMKNFKKRRKSTDQKLVELEFTKSGVKQKGVTEAIPAFSFKKSDLERAAKAAGLEWKNGKLEGDITRENYHKFKRYLRNKTYLKDEPVTYREAFDRAVKEKAKTNPSEATVSVFLDIFSRLFVDEKEEVIDSKMKLESMYPEKYKEFKNFVEKRGLTVEEALKQMKKFEKKREKVKKK